MRGKNLSLIGPPGSGKGSYGRLLAKALDIPLVTISDVLRTVRPDLDLSGGHLIDDQTVSDVLIEHLSNNDNNQHNHPHNRPHHVGYLLDGFPRTIQQAHMMESLWPTKLRIDAVIKLAVPDKVCEVKLLGRRLCSQCNGNYNINNVDFDGWYMPPSLPNHKNKNLKGSTIEGEDVDGGSIVDYACDEPGCNPNTMWMTRDDDQPDIVKGRLAVYHEHMDPILNYFDKHDQLLKIYPYHGYDDVPKIIDKVKDFLSQGQEEEE